MKKILWTLAAFTCIISPTFANLEGTVQWDIMLTSMEDSVMSENTIIDENLEFYRDGKNPTIYKNLDELLKNEKNVTTVTDGCNNGFVMGTWAALTMMYCEDIYGTNWGEKWQRTDTKVTIYWDDTKFFNQKIFQKLDGNKKLSSGLHKKMQSLSNEKLAKVSEKISNMIEKVKLSRIVKQEQDRKITQLYFIKISIDDVLRSK